MGGSYASLARFAPLAAALLLVLMLALLPRLAERGHQEPIPPEGGGPAAGPRTTAVRLLIGAGLAALLAFGQQYAVFWGLAVVWLGYQFWTKLPRSGLHHAEPADDRWNVLAMGTAVVLAVAAALLINRINVDQTLSIHMSVAALDQPQAPLLSRDTIHGLANVRQIPSYRVHSFELLAAWLSQLASIAEPLVLLHVYLAPLLAVISVLAGARLMRLLTPSRWGWATLVLVLLLLSFRSTYSSYGNYAFVRLFEGKSLFVTALVPLILAYALEWSASPTAMRWIMLFACQVAAVGLTANAVYAGPIAAGLALAGTWRPAWETTRRTALGLLASIYSVIVGLVVRGEFIRQGLVSGLAAFEPLVPMEQGLRLVLAAGSPLWLWLLALTSAWSLASRPSTRHWLLAFSLGSLLTALNPFLTAVWGEQITANYLTWRLMWSIPLPAMLALMLTDGLANELKTAWVAHGLRLALAAAVGLAVVRGRTWVDPTGLDPRLGPKVPPAEYAVAERLNELAGPAAPVLAPEVVAAWIPAQRMHAYPLVARRHYTAGILSVFAGQVDAGDLRQRLALLDVVEGRTPGPAGFTLLAAWAADGRLAAVAVPRNHPELDQVTGILLDAGYRQQDYLGYRLFDLPS